MLESIIEKDEGVLGDTSTLVADLDILVQYSWRRGIIASAEMRFLFEYIRMTDLNRSRT